MEKRLPKSRKTKRANICGVVYFSVLPPESIVSLLMYLCLQKQQYTLRQRTCIFAEKFITETNNQDLLSKKTPTLGPRDRQFLLING